MSTAFTAVLLRGKMVISMTDYSELLREGISILHLMFGSDHARARNADWGVSPGSSLAHSGRT